MAEENNNGAMPDVSDADPPIPPIDNIHAPKTEPDLPPAMPQEMPQQPIQPSHQIEIEMPEAVVRGLENS